MTVNTSGLSLNGSLSATYLYAGEATSDGIVFKAGNSGAGRRTYQTKILFGKPTGLSSTEGTTYTCQGYVPEGFTLERITRQTAGWDVEPNSDNTVLTATRTVQNGAAAPLPPTVWIEAQEAESKPYGIKITSQNDIYVPIYDTI